jgi:hypothetical protein
MRQWELFGITDTVSTWAPPPKPEPPLDPAAEIERTIVADPFPITLWTTDASLRFTTRPGDAAVGLARSTDVFAAFGPEESDVVEAHVRALKGAASSFDLHRHGRSFRCWVSPVRVRDQRIVGTMCVGLESGADMPLDPTVEYA